MRRLWANIDPVGIDVDDDDDDDDDDDHSGVSPGIPLFTC